MYDPLTVLAAIDTNPWPFLLPAAAAFIGNAVYYVELLRLGFAERMYTMPLMSTFFFIPHDLSYVLHFQKWFVEYDHWLPQLMFVPLLVTSICAFVFLYQAVRFGHKELMPWASPRVFRTLVLLGVVAGAALWSVVKNAVDDDLYFFAFGVTAFWCAPFGMGLILRRGSRAAQSKRMWMGYVAIPLFWWIAVWPYAPFFRSPEWVILGAVAVAAGVANIFLLGRLPTQK